MHKTTGVYKLTFKTGHYYIGQSINLSKRKLEHYKMLMQGTHHSYKMQEHYIKQKELPEFNVLLECDIDSLGKEESRLINLKDPLCLNVKPGEIQNYGYLAPTAKYLTLEIETAFLLLVNNPGIQHKEVSECQGVDISTVHDISAGRNRAFTEMSKAYPDLYAKLLKQKAPNTRGKTTIVLKHEDGRVVTLVSGQYAEFCRSTGVQQPNLSKVIQGNRKTTLGWSLVEKYENI